MLSVDDSSGPNLLTRINTCYSGGPIKIPFIHNYFDFDDVPNWMNPDHGTHQKNTRSNVATSKSTCLHSKICIPRSVRN